MSEYADLKARIEGLEAELSAGSFYKETDIDMLMKRAEAAETKLAVAVEAIEACVASLERADTTEGVCCCGDSMEQHSDPMWCGHSPVDMGTYYAANAIEAARAALAQIKGDE